jgi:hypothetical protein
MFRKLDNDLGRRQFPGRAARFEALRLVIAIAERLVLRVAAAAERDHFSAREPEFFSFEVVDCKIPLNADRAIVVYCDFS